MNQDIEKQDEGKTTSADEIRKKKKSKHEKLSSESHFFHITFFIYSHIHFKRFLYFFFTMDALAINVFYYFFQFQKRSFKVIRF